MKNHFKFNILMIFAALMSSIGTVMSYFNGKAVFGVATLNPIGPQNTLTYDAAMQTSIGEGSTKIQYDDRIYDDIWETAGFLMILDMMRNTDATSTVTRSFERTLPRFVNNISGAVAAQTDAATPLKIAFASALEKAAVMVGTVLELGYSAGAGYTKYAYVSDKTTGCNSVQVLILPIQTPGGSEKIGANSVDGIPDGIKVTVGATRRGAAEGAVDPTEFLPEVVENYMQFSGTPYSITNQADKARLYTPGGWKNDLEKQARMKHFITMKNTVLLNGPKRYDKVSDGGVTGAIGDRGYMQGLINWILTNAGDKNKLYTNFSVDGVVDWSNSLFDSSISDKYMNRFVLCNTAWATAIWKEKMARGFELSKIPIDTYGIPGLRRMELPKGSFDYQIEPTLDSRFGTDPFAVALSLDHLEFQYFEATYLAANIQQPDKPISLNEFRSTYTLFPHGFNRHGVFYTSSHGL
jgi:hypothetical protein